VLLGLVALLVLLAAKPATATLVLGDICPSSVGCADSLLASLASQLLASAELPRPAPHTGASPARSEDKEDDRPAFQLLEGLLPAPAAGCHTNSVSQSSGSGSTGAALASAVGDVPPPGLWATLPSEAKTILPTGPPFELLRPPQVG
jgi:hypothetical protein